MVCGLNQKADFKQINIAFGIVMAVIVRNVPPCCLLQVNCYQTIRGHKIIFTAAMLSKCDDFTTVRS